MPVTTGLSNLVKIISHEKKLLFVIIYYLLYSVNR